MMGQVSLFLRRATNGYAHWCPACGETHLIPDSWKFNDDVNRPTFAPSVKVTGVQTVAKDGEWTGEWVRGADGKALPSCCHYFLESGQLCFQPDCSHEFAGKTVPLPPLPDFLTDKNLKVISI